MDLQRKVGFCRDSVWWRERQMWVPLVSYGWFLFIFVPICFTSYRLSCLHNLILVFRWSIQSKAYTQKAKDKRCCGAVSLSSGYNFFLFDGVTLRWCYVDDLASYNELFVSLLLSFRLGELFFALLCCAISCSCRASFLDGRLIFSLINSVLRVRSCWKFRSPGVVGFRGNPPMFFRVPYLLRGSSLFPHLQRFLGTPDLKLAETLFHNQACVRSETIE